MTSALFPRTRSFLYGALLPYRALRLILSKKSLLFMSAGPITLALVLYFLVIHRTQVWAVDHLHNYLLHFGFQAGGWLVWSVDMLARIFLVIVGILTFTFMSSIVASPFNDFLAERAERFATPPLTLGQHTSLGEKIRLIWIDLFKTLAALVMSLVALLISWVPILNLVGFALAFLLISFQYLTYPQTRRGWNVGSGLLFVLRHAFSCIGFGLSMSVLFSVPLLSSFSLPLAVVGGTLLFARAQANDAFRLR